MKQLVALVSILAPLSSFAHDGHSHISASSVLHYLTSPVHFVPMALGVLGAALWFFKAYAKKYKEFHR